VAGFRGGEEVGGGRGVMKECRRIFGMYPNDVCARLMWRMTWTMSNGQTSFKVAI
jgi:hypothetical protein